MARWPRAEPCLPGCPWAMYVDPLDLSFRVLLLNLSLKSLP